MDVIVGKNCRFNLPYDEHDFQFDDDRSPRNSRPSTRNSEVCDPGRIGSSQQAEQPILGGSGPSGSSINGAGGASNGNGAAQASAGGPPPEAQLTDGQRKTSRVLSFIYRAIISLLSVT
jgi:hypothetical protein